MPQGSLARAASAAPAALFKSVSVQFHQPPHVPARNVHPEQTAKAISAFHADARKPSLLREPHARDVYLVLALDGYEQQRSVHKICLQDKTRQDKN
jgi:hypothetical protein